MDAEDHREIQEAEKLLEQQSIVGTLLGSAVGAVPALLIYYIIISQDAMLVISIVVPGIIIGFAARFTGRGMSLKHNIVAGLVTLSGLVAMWLYMGLTAIGLLMSLINVPIAAALASRKLNEDEEKLMFRYKYKHKRI